VCPMSELGKVAQRDTVTADCYLAVSLVMFIAML